MARPPHDAVTAARERLTEATETPTAEDQAFARASYELTGRGGPGAARGGGWGGGRLAQGSSGERLPPLGVLAREQSSAGRWAPRHPHTGHRGHQASGSSHRTSYLLTGPRAEPPGAWTTMTLTLCVLHGLLYVHTDDKTT